jgi:hypothetical protein
MINSITELDRCPGAWPLELRCKCQDSSFSSELAALLELFKDLDALKESRAEFLKTPVLFPEAALGHRKTIEAIFRAVETGKPFGALSFGHSEAKEHISSIRVEGRPPSSIRDWSRVQEWVLLHEQVLTFETKWNALQGALSLPPLNGGVSRLREIEVVASAARESHKLATSLDVRLSAEAGRVFQDGPRALQLGLEQLKLMRHQMLRHLDYAELSQTAGQLSDIQQKLAGKSGTVADTFRSFVQDSLGNPEFTGDKAVAIYAEILQEMRRIPEEVRALTVALLSSDREGSRADRVSRGHPAICSSGTSNRRFIWLVTLSFTLFAGIGAHRLQAIPMPAPGSLFSLIAVWPTTRSMPIPVA